MNNKEFSKQLELRTRKFAVSIIKLSATLPSTCEAKVIRNQISKSGTSIGANYREANRPRSIADFGNKIRICESEANETLYWLEIVSDMNWRIRPDFDLVYSEAAELLALFTSISGSLNK